MVIVRSRAVLVALKVKVNGWVLLEKVAEGRVEGDVFVVDHVGGVCLRVFTIVCENLNSGPDVGLKGFVGHVIYLDEVDHG